MEHIWTKIGNEYYIENQFHKIKLERISGVVTSKYETESVIFYRVRIKRNGDKTYKNLSMIKKMIYSIPNLEKDPHKILSRYSERGRIWSDENEVLNYTFKKLLEFNLIFIEKGA